MNAAVDFSSLSGYTYRPSRYNADGTENGKYAFLDNILEKLRAPAAAPDLAALQQEMDDKHQEFLGVVDPFGENKSHTWYGNISPEELLLEYDFVPASAGIPNGPDPFTAYYNFVEGDEGYINHMLAPIIPVFGNGASSTLHPDGRITLDGPVAGYFVKKGALTEFRVSTIAMRGSFSSEDTQKNLFATLWNMFDKDGSESASAGERNAGGIEYDRAMEILLQASTYRQNVFPAP
jgi:hypothetical protein